MKDVGGVWAQWDAIKQTEKVGTINERRSAFDGIPRHLPALMRAHDTVKKARKHGLLSKGRKSQSKEMLGRQLYQLAQRAQASGWQSEELLRAETARQEKILRQKEKARQK